LEQALLRREEAEECASHQIRLFLTRAEIIIGLGERGGIPSRHRTVSLLHVTAAEPIDLAAAA
jgi:hypothetical protein